MTISQAGKNENGEALGYLQVNSRANQHLIVFTLKKGDVRNVCDFLQDDNDIFQPYKFSIFMFF